LRGLVPIDTIKPIFIGISTASFTVFVSLNCFSNKETFFDKKAVQFSRIILLYKKDSMKLLWIHI